MPEDFWLAFGISGALAWPCLALLRKVKSSSVISPYAPPAHQDKSGTPNMGGLFLLAGIVGALLIQGSAVSRNELAWVVVGVALFALIGFLDDYAVPRLTSKRGIGWMQKLGMQVIAAAAFAAPVGDTTSAILTGFFVVLFANAVNFADGLDALAGSLLIVAMLPFSIYFVDGGALPAAISLAVCGATIPFLFLNAPPAKVFLGDVGSLPLGALLGYVFIASPWRESPWPWFAVSVFLIELVLVPVQIAAVKTIKRKLFPATPIHHGFEVIGWPESRVLWSFLLTQVVLSAAAITIEAS